MLRLASAVGSVLTLYVTHDPVDIFTFSSLWPQRAVDSSARAHTRGRRSVNVAPSSMPFGILGTADLQSAEVTRSS